VALPFHNEDIDLPLDRVPFRKPQQKILGNKMSESGAASTTPVQVKLVLLGEAAVGKSSVVLRFVQNDFQENKEPTIGAAFLTQKCKLDDKTIKFEI